MVVEHGLPQGLHGGSREALEEISIIDSLAIGVDRIHRNFDPPREQVERWRSNQITDEQASIVIYRAFIENQLDVPRHLARDVHKNYLGREFVQTRHCRQLCG